MKYAPKGEEEFGTSFAVEWHNVDTLCKQVSAEKAGRSGLM